jgi:hypothetical protein
MMTFILEGEHFSHLNEVANIENLEKVIKQLFQTEFGIDYTDNQYRKLDRFRNKQGLFKYVQGLRTLRNDDLICHFSTFMKSVLESPDGKILFLEERYDQDKVPHLAIVFQGRQALEREWRKGTEKMSISKIDFSSFARSKKKTIQERMKLSILTHHHLSKNAPVLFPLLFACLLNRKESGVATNPFEKAAIDLFNSSNENELKALEELAKHPSGQEFDNDVQGWLKAAKRDSMIGDFVVVDTDDPFDLFAMGDEVNTCQRTDGQPDLNQGLLGYLLNGYNRLIAIKDEEGRIVARSLLRLLYNKRANKPVLFLDSFYSRNNHEDLEKIIKALALERAKKMKLTLLSGENHFNSYGENVSCFGGAAPEYIDSFGRVRQGPFCISDTFVLYEPKELSCILS